MPNLIFLFGIFALILSVSCGEKELSDLDSEQYEKWLLKTDKIDEASGLAASTKNLNILWTHNDSGDDSFIYAIDTKGNYLGSIKFTGYSAIDFEDICVGPSTHAEGAYIYIADTGDNQEIRDVKQIIRFKEPKTADFGSGFEISTKDYEVINFKFPQARYDVEALMIDPESRNLYLVTKRTDLAQVFRLKNPNSVTDTLIAEQVTTLPIGEAKTGSIVSRVCGGDISKNGNGILIKNYDSVYYFGKKADETIEEAFERTPQAKSYIPEPQGEAICFSNKGDGYFTLSERSRFELDQYLYFYRFND